MAEQFDLIVVGGGSGGLAAAQRAAEYGARAVVIEDGRLGGTCVNVGCVPKKVMWHASDIAHTLGDAADYGFAIERPDHDWTGLKARRDAYVKRLNGIYQRNLDNKGVELIRSRGRLTGPHSVEAGGQQLSGERILIATGGYPAVPDLPGAEMGITSDGFFELEERPQRIAMVGSGYISVELAGMLSSLGSDVTLFARYDSVLRSFDDMLQAAVIEGLEDAGTKLSWHSVPAALEGGPGDLTLLTEDGTDHGPFDSVIWAVGRTPNILGLGLADAGLETDARGFIPTDEFQETAVPGVFAVGDVTGRAALTPVAIAAGRRFADRVWGGMAGRKLSYENIPSVVFSHPAVGTVGMTEAQAIAEFGSAVKTYTSDFVSLQYGISDHKPRSRMKLVTAGEEERIVGLHVCGVGADEMLQGFAVAIRMGATKEHFDETVAIHPTSAEEFVTMR